VNGQGSSKGGKGYPGPTRGDPLWKIWRRKTIGRTGQPSFIWKMVTKPEMKMEYEVSMTDQSPMTIPTNCGAIVLRLDYTGTRLFTGGKVGNVEI